MNTDNQGLLSSYTSKKAYDSVLRKALWRGLQILGVPTKVIQLLSSFHMGMLARVRNGHRASIAVNNGL